MTRRMKTVEERFWEKVQKTDGCWLWTASTTAFGYGQLNVDRKNFRAHRLSFKMHHGYLPEVVRHTCDNPLCVNPEHLLAGTQGQNLQDARERGRASKPPTTRGAENSQAKLTDALVREARSEHSAGLSLRALAKKYAVDRKTITQAVRGEHWSHV